MLVAVYGSLKKGFGNNYLLKDALFVGEGITDKKYKMLSFGGYPGLIDGDKAVKVEVYNVSPSQLENLDGLEGHPSFYEREQVPIDMGDQKVLAWMYTIRKHNKYYTYPTYQNEEDGVLVWETDLEYEYC